jgi:hypothetical protein
LIGVAVATEEARLLTSPGPQVPAQSMAATFYWSARGLALESPWHVASPWAATG